jgi:hypothetical protein
MSRRRAVALVALAAALVSATSRATAGGVIDTMGAIVDSGAGTPKGAVTIDASAPPATPPNIAAVPAIGAIGAIDGTMPAFAGGGAGGLGAADFASSTSLAGGTYEFTTYTIESNVGVTYTGAVTIRTTGDMTLDGGIRTTAAGASVTIQCGGNLVVNPHIGGNTEGVETVGGAAPVVIDVNGTITTTASGSTTSLIRSNSGDTTIRQHGTAAPMSLTRLDASALTVLGVFSAGGISTSNSSFTGNAVEVRAFGGDTTGTTTTFFADSRTRVQSSGSTTFVNGGQVRSSDGIDVAAITGDVVVDGTTVAGGGAVATADMTLRAGRDVTFQNAPVVTHQSAGSVVVRAFGGDVTFEPTSATNQAKLQLGGGGLVDVQASSDVSIGGQSVVQTVGGGVKLAAGHIVFLRDACQVLALEGALDVSADAAVITSGTAFGQTVRGATVNIGSPNGDVILSLGSLQSTNGALTIVAAMNASVHGTISSVGELRVASIGGGVDVYGAKLLTADSVSGPTGAVLIESFKDGAGISAKSASVTSGAAGSSKSGDVSLLVHRAPVFDGYLLPTKVALKIGKDGAAHSVVNVAGTFDLGRSATDVSGAATLTIGDLAIPVSLVKDAKGRYRQKSTSFDFSVVPAKSGSSRATFTLKAIGDFGAIVAFAGDGALLVRFAHPQVDAVGRVVLTKGKYAAGKKRASLWAPGLALVRAKATIVGMSGDSLDLLLAFATDGTTPAAAPDVVVAFGPTFTVAVPGAAFGAAKKGVFKKANPSAGVLSVTLDYAHETIAVKAKKTDLGAIATGTGVPVDVVVSLGADVRTVRVRLGGKGTKTAY